MSTAATLPSASERKTGRTNLLCAIDDESLDFSYPDAPSDQCTVTGLPSAADLLAAGSEPVEDVFSPQGLNRS